MKAPAFTARERAGLSKELQEALRLCERWAGRKVGDEYPCNSPLIGRQLDVKPSRRSPRQVVEVVGCAVPRSDRPSKRCKPDYLVQPARGQGLLPLVMRVDGGTIRNASRTPRPTHDPPLAPDRDDPRRWRAYGYAQAANAEQGLPLMTGLDVTYRHRAGSSICCPDHPWSVPVLGESLRWALEGEGIDAELSKALLGLGRHLRDRHGVAVDVPRRLAPDDEAAALAILAASDAYCAKVATEWEARQAEEEKARRAAPRKRRASKTQAAKGKRKRAVHRSMTHTRAELMRGLGAGGVEGRRVFYVMTADGETNVGVTAANEFATHEAAAKALAAYQKRTGDRRRLVVRSAPYEKPRKLAWWEMP